MKCEYCRGIGACFSCCGRAAIDELKEKNKFLLEILTEWEMNADPNPSDTITRIREKARIAIQQARI